MLEHFILNHKLPESFRDTATEYYAPIAERIYGQFQQSTQPLFVGVNGCQGSGKSTFTAFTAQYLTEKYQLKVAVMSLDDFYLTSAQREQLAQDVHPLLRTRGVPGTHNIELLDTTLNNFKHKKTGFLVPKFDKSVDEPFPKSSWLEVQSPVDIVLFEGWCWGVTAQHQTQLISPVNKLEIEEDKQGIWRKYVNATLKQDYEPLYKFMNYWIVLQAPSFSCVYDWRLEQEQKLEKKMAEENKNLAHTTIMNANQIFHFIQHHQRLTLHGLTTPAQSADLKMCLDEDRLITKLVVKKSNND